MLGSLLSGYYSWMSLGVLECMLGKIFVFVSGFECIMHPARPPPEPPPGSSLLGYYSWISLGVLLWVMMLGTIFGFVLGFQSDLQ